MFAGPPGLHLLLSSGLQPRVDVICVCGRNWCFLLRWKLSVPASCGALGVSARSDLLFTFPAAQIPEF